MLTKEKLTGIASALEAAGLGGARVSLCTAPGDVVALCGLAEIGARVERTVYDRSSFHPDPYVIVSASLVVGSITFSVQTDEAATPTDEEALRGRAVDLPAPGRFARVEFAP